MSTTPFPSLGSLRALAASRRRGFVAGSTWSSVVDRDLDRMAAELLVLSHADAEHLAATAEPAVRPLALPHRVARAFSHARPARTAPRPRAS
ncbi:hypothetical protein [Intrasporangium calvum]|uniref:Uncharacterized protein n=1 Tax=Intrasporangium calvum (strain ATCC 23552 / DSM 43043 / JCM 3097 / NBRC 12989 / NCIMB 10167 / NRRL B-3866 / 7 KIP) TaxID=710696 RepID=E6SCV7_INTC7|nr:hypothetical protein [Intrasporangium calvum]ADU47512.1 protein of unknown function DUF853 NPT hydrolase putative [Intrasporangium calvum DSM 43043]AXG12715.1 hypothetical protein DN585_04140 [Intrasporangium calvum]